MYRWITDTWNVCKGACPHDCSYCYMKRWGPQKPLRFDEKELKTDLGSGKFIFVGSSCDMFAADIPLEWKSKIINRCLDFDNTYLFQTKNPRGIFGWRLPEKSFVCTTLESDIFYPEIMRQSPEPFFRSLAMNNFGDNTFVTIEPILDFNLGNFVRMIRLCHPIQVNIGADSQKHNLPEPSPEKIRDLIEALKEFAKVELKSNLNRLLK